MPVWIGARLVSHASSPDSLIFRAVLELCSARCLRVDAETSGLCSFRYSASAKPLGGAHPS